MAFSFAWHTVWFVANTSCNVFGAIPPLLVLRRSEHSTIFDLSLNITQLDKV